MRTPDPKKPILLDTHVWLWLLNKDKKLASSKCLSLIENAVKFSNIKISAISIWEIGMLEAKDRIVFPVDCLDWINQALSAPGISLAPITPEIAVESTRLPGNFHGDPADRIIVATARKLDAILVTDDKKIYTYGNNGFVEVFSPQPRITVSKSLQNGH